MSEDLSILEAIKARRSVRNYASYPPEEIKTYVEDLFAKLLARPSPFPGDEGRPHSDFLRLSYIADPLGFTSTYGVIRGYRHWLCPASKKDDPHKMLRLGLVLEEVVIYLTSKGMGTVWLGGTYTIAQFAEKISLDAEKEEILAVMPVGVPAGDGYVARALSWISGSSTRREWGDLFFKEKFGVPLTEQDMSEQEKNTFEAIRRAPSAVNGQPWRIVFKAEGKKYLFFRQGGSGGFGLMDLGIGMTNWKMAWEEQGMEGTWSFSGEDESYLKELEIPDDAVYVGTWVAKQ